MYSLLRASVFVLPQGRFGGFAKTLITLPKMETTSRTLPNIYCVSKTHNCEMRERLPNSFLPTVTHIEWPLALADHYESVQTPKSRSRQKQKKKFSKSCTTSDTSCLTSLLLSPLPQERCEPPASSPSSAWGCCFSEVCVSLPVSSTSHATMLFSARVYSLSLQVRNSTNTHFLSLHHLFIVIIIIIIPGAIVTDWWGNVMLVGRRSTSKQMIITYLVVLLSLLLLPWQQRSTLICMDCILVVSIIGRL